MNATHSDNVRSVFLILAIAAGVFSSCEGPTPEPRSVSTRTRAVTTSPLVTAVIPGHGDSIGHMQDPTAVDIDPDGGSDQSTVTEKVNDETASDSREQDQGGMVAEDLTSSNNQVDDEPKKPQIQPLSDEEAMIFLKDKCISCHDAKDGSVRSFWALDRDSFSKDEFIASPSAPAVYFTLLMRSKNIVGGKPAAMPPDRLGDDDQAKLMRLLVWFEREASAAVSLARARYGGSQQDDGNGVGVLIDYKCETPATFREYIRRVTNDVFSREPTAVELALGANGPDKPTTREDRQKIASMLLTDSAWKAEFIDKGLKKFADKLSGAAQIEKSEPDLTQAQADDLKLEFYQILRQNFLVKSYKDILLSNKVMVSANTASLYGCMLPPAGTWTECEMTSPRSSYFTTFSYLRSKPSSYLVENNNYGRAALMYFVLRGDVFQAALDQKGGSESVRAIPTCLQSVDYRGRLGTETVAPFGALGVPQSANLCQSCHIQRQMAAGSILFRPFNKVGNMYGVSHPINRDPDFASAVGGDMVNSLPGRAEFVDELFLQNLLTSSSEKACVPGEQGKPDTMLNNVADLAMYIIGDGFELAGGLARHLPRAFSNLANTSEEVIILTNKAWADGGGKLGPVFQAYFASETYACSKR